MFSNKGFKIPLWCVIVACLVCESFGQHEGLDSNFIREPLEYDYTNRDKVNNAIESSGDRINGGGIGWWDTARHALSGPAGQIIVSMAKEMISRSTGNSQILSLNLTNLLILILLKALIFAAGLIGAGNWAHYARARSMDSSLFLNEEAPLFIGYLALEGSGQDGCLNRAACKAPGIAKEYVKAAKAIIKGTEMFGIEYNATDHLNTISMIEQSIRDGMDGAICNSAYNCQI